MKTRELDVIKIRPGEQMGTIRVWYNDTELQRIVSIEYSQDFGFNASFPLVTIKFLARLDADIELRGEDATLTAVAE